MLMSQGRSNLISCQEPTLKIAEVFISLEPKYDFNPIGDRKYLSIPTHLCLLVEKSTFVSGSGFEQEKCCVNPPEGIRPGHDL